LSRTICLKPQCGHFQNDPIAGTRAPSSEESISPKVTPRSHFLQSMTEYHLSRSTMSIRIPNCAARTAGFPRTKVAIPARERKSEAALSERALN
jgi:hypothetical protein